MSQGLSACVLGVLLAAACGRGEERAPPRTVFVPAGSAESLDGPSPTRGAGAAPRGAPLPQDREHAERLFQEARELMQKGRLDEACARFSESLELDRAVGTLLNLASCMERSGRVPRACELYAEARDLSKTAGSDARARFAEDRRAALGCP
ncbi:MAG: tetratricopeptide repeat protein [Myxococcales bacterium]|nr:tetratricopeptide repeat protein [Myxococcales bacterium]